MSDTSNNSRQTLRRVETLPWGALPVLGIVLLLTAGCSSRGQSTAGDVTGAVSAEPQRAAVVAPPNAQPVATAPATVVSARPSRLAGCGPGYAANEVTGSIRRRDEVGERARPHRLVGAVGRVIHVIEPRETLYSIARRHHTTVGEIARINDIDPNAMIRAGYVLLVPRA